MNELVEMEASFSGEIGKIIIESTFYGEISKIRLKNENMENVYSLVVIGDTEQHTFGVNSDVKLLRSIAQSFKSKVKAEIEK